MEETLDKLELVFSTIHLKAKKGLQLIKTEIQSRFTAQPYKYEKEIKYVLYRLTSELKAAIMVLFSQSFISGINQDKGSDEDFIARINDLVKKSSSHSLSNDQDSDNMLELRLFVNNQPMEIKFTPFLI